MNLIIITLIDIQQNNYYQLKMKTRNHGVLNLIQIKYLDFIQNFLNL